MGGAALSNTLRTHGSRSEQASQGTALAELLCTAFGVRFGLGCRTVILPACPLPCFLQLGSTLAGLFLRQTSARP